MAPLLHLGRLDGQRDLIGGVVGVRVGGCRGTRLFEMLPERRIVTIAKATSLLDTTKPTATKAVVALVDAGVLVETTGRKRDRTLCYNGYLDLLRTGTELDHGLRR